MIVRRPDGTEWRVENAAEKLDLRATLPGARLFDLAADGLRRARTLGLPNADRLALALPASWCVNSPAPSTVLRRWALAPQRDVLLSLVALLEEDRRGPVEREPADAIALALRALGAEPFVLEAVSKVLALLVPDAVPLLPAPALSFLFGEPLPTGASAFVGVVDWFADAVQEHGAELASYAEGHRAVPLCAAQVLDRLMWFDSEGHRHFPRTGRGTPSGAAATPSSEKGEGQSDR